MMIDKELTELIQDWLGLPVADRDLGVGAELLLRLNRNQFMYHRILRKGDMATLVYQLEKHLRIRLDGFTLDELVSHEERLKEDVAALLVVDAPVVDVESDVPAATRRGKRVDHDELPSDVQSLYDRGGELYFKIKSLHATLGEMVDAPVCDRYEYCKLLSELYDEYRRGWELYDGYGQEVSGSELSAEDAKAVSAARKYISTNKGKLSSALSEEKRSELVAKLQERVNLLLGLSQVISEDTRSELSALGVCFDVVED